MDIAAALQQKIDTKTKPVGSLGRLEELALQLGRVQNTLSPRLRKPHILVFAADHGIAGAGVSLYPKEVTFQMVNNFLNGGAAINVFARQNNITLKIIDAGIDHNFPSHPKLIDHKVAHGTRNMLEEAAMTQAQLEKCLEFGKEIINNHLHKKTNIVGFGEMGIGNTSSAALLMSKLCGLPIDECVGRGTGLGQPQLQKKIEILEQVLQKHPKAKLPMEVLATFGGFEIAQMAGAMLEAFEKNMLLMIDGFIATAAFLVVYHLQPTALNNVIFCHVSDEQGHAKMLDYLNAQPILDLQMRLGEGTGCAVAYPIIQSATTFLNEMASFEDAGVST